MRRTLAYVMSLVVLGAAAWMPYIAYAQVLPGSPFGGGSGGGGAVYPVSDATFGVSDDGDPTKIFKVQVSGVTTGNTVTPFAFNGTAAAPGVVIASTLSAETTRVTVLDTVAFGFGTGLPAAPTAFWMRESAAEIQQGADINGTGTNQVYKGPDGITGTDRIGGSLTLRPGRGTGAGVSAPLTFDRVITKATGTTAQTYAPAVIVCPTKILSNTSATTTTIATITTTTTSGGTVEMDYGNTACSAAVCNQDSGQVKVSWNNAAGTVAATMGAIAGQSDSDGSGTLAATPTATVATNVVSIKLTPTWVTIVPTSVVGYATFTVHSAADTVVCQ